MTACEHIEQAQAGLDSVEVYLDVHGDPDSAQICQLDALLALGHALTSVARSLAGSAVANDLFNVICIAGILSC